MLKTLSESGFRGWVCYFDADGYIADLNFDLEAYLSERSEYAFIGAYSGIIPQRWWDINIGILFINLGHPEARKIVHEWHESFMQITDDEMRLAVAWDMIPNDQYLFHEVINHTPAREALILHDNGILNTSDARFARQVLRAAAASYVDRLLNVERDVNAVFRRHGLSGSVSISRQVLEDMSDGDLIAALYKVLLLREPDDGGLYANVQSFRDKGRDIAWLIENCLRCDEFRDKFPLFCQTYGLDRMTIRL